jgi:hypothetical protein
MLCQRYDHHHKKCTTYFKKNGRLMRRQAFYILEEYDDVDERPINCTDICSNNYEVDQENAVIRVKNGCIELDTACFAFTEFIRMELPLVKNPYMLTSFTIDDNQAFIVHHEENNKQCFTLVIYPKLHMPIYIHDKKIDTVNSPFFVVPDRHNPFLLFIICDYPQKLMYVDTMYDTHDSYDCPDFLIKGPCEGYLDYFLFASEKYVWARPFNINENWIKTGFRPDDIPFRKKFKKDFYSSRYYFAKNECMALLLCLIDLPQELICIILNHAKWPKFYES